MSWTGPKGARKSSPHRTYNLVRKRSAKQHSKRPSSRCRQADMLLGRTGIAIWSWHSIYPQPRV